MYIETDSTSLEVDCYAKGGPIYLEIAAYGESKLLELSAGETQELIDLLHLAVSESTGKRVEAEDQIGVKPAPPAHDR